MFLLPLPRMHKTCYRSVRFGLVRNRLRLCLCLQVNNVNTAESLACSSVWQHFRQAQATRQQRLEWRDLSPCVCICVCLCGKVDHLKVEHCFGFFLILGGKQRVCTLGTESAPKSQFSVALNESQRDLWQLVSI